MIGELFRSTANVRRRKGIVRDIDTSRWARGDDVYLDPQTPGGVFIISEKWDRRVFGAMLVWVAITGIATLLIAGFRWYYN